MTIMENARASAATIADLAEIASSGKKTHKALTRAEEKAIKHLVNDGKVSDMDMPQAIHLIREAVEGKETVLTFRRIINAMFQSRLTDREPAYCEENFIPKINNLRLVEQMDNMRLSNNELAKAMNASGSTVAGWRTGVYAVIGTEKCLKVARATGANPFWLCAGASGQFACEWVETFAKGNAAFEKNPEVTVIQIGDVDVDVPMEQLPDPFTGEADATPMLLSEMMRGFLDPMLVERIRDMEVELAEQDGIIAIQEKVIDNQKSLIGTFETALAELTHRKR